MSVSSLLRACAAAAFLAIGLASGYCPAQPKEDSGAMARRFFNAGQKAFAEGRFTDAAKAFEEAFRIKSHPAPLINAGDSYEKAGEYAQAARTYQRVLDLPESGEQDRADAVDRLSRLNPRLGILELIGDEETRARVDDDEFRGGNRVYLFPGEHSVTLVDVEGAKVRKLEIAAGTTRSIDLKTLLPGPGDEQRPPPPPGGEPDPTPEEPEAKRGIGAATWLAFGVAAVGVGGGVYFGLQVNDAEQSYNENPNRDDLDRFNQNKLYANIGWGVAAVGGVLGTIFLISDLSGGKKPAPAEPVGSLSFDFTPIPGGASLLTRSRF
jgi:tetratricopeptide (TPR) repeat protein